VADNILVACGYRDGTDYKFKLEAVQDFIDDYERNLTSKELQDVASVTAAPTTKGYAAVAVAEALKKAMDARDKMTKDVRSGKSIHIRFDYQDGIISGLTQADIILREVDAVAPTQWSEEIPVVAGYYWFYGCPWWNHERDHNVSVAFEPQLYNVEICAFSRGRFLAKTQSSFMPQNKAEGTRYGYKGVWTAACLPDVAAAQRMLETSTNESSE
jgi:hypothetical protein